VSSAEPIASAAPSRASPAPPDARGALGERRGGGAGRVAGGLDEGVGAVDEVGGRGDEAGVGRDVPGDGAQVARAGVDGALEGGGEVEHLVVVEVVLQVGQGARADLAHGLGEGLADVGLHGRHGLVGHDRRDRVALLVGLVDEGGGVDVVGGDGEQGGGEVLRDQDRRVVAPGAHALLGLLARGDLVADLVARAQLGGHRLAQVEGHGQAPGGVALVAVGDGDAQAAGVAVGVPAAGDVEPGVERRDHDQAHADHERDHVARGVAGVEAEDAPDLPHRSSPPSAGPPSAAPASS
jgi:hypothetical protein